MKVFDASAVLALLNSEAGAEQAAALMEDGDGLVCSANYAEVVAKLVDRGLAEQHIVAAWKGLPLAVQPLDDAAALVSSLLRESTRSLGLSLGDRCCLALAQQLDAEVVTADRAWKALKGFRITLIR